MSVQRQRRCDGRTYRAETVEQRVDSGWRNEDAVVQQLQAMSYKITEWILNTCMNYAKGLTKYSGAISAERL